MIGLQGVLRQTHHRYLLKKKIIIHMIITTNTYIFHTRIGLIIKTPVVIIIITLTNINILIIDHINEIHLIQIIKKMKT